MADRLMYIPFPNDNKQITHPVDYNLWLKRLDTKINEQTNQNSMKVPKVINPLKKKKLL